MKIGILQSAGIAGDIIDIAFNHPEQEEVFTPVVYSKENQNDKNVGSDLKFGNIAGVVVAPGSATTFNFEGSMEIYIDDAVRLAVAMPGKDAPEAAASLSQDVLTERVNKALMSLHRDFLCSVPRIAVIALNTALDEVEKTVISPAVAALNEKEYCVFGPYTLDDYIESGKYRSFDLTLVITDAQAEAFLSKVTADTRTRFIAGIPMVMAQTDYPATYAFDKSCLEKPALALRSAIYHVIDICRCRAQYDEAHKSPLPKLYHERRDDSEKVRFAIPKKKSENNS